METNKETAGAAEIVDLGAACREVTRLVRGVPDTGLSGPTPCPDYTVAQLLAHLVGLTVAFRDAAAKKLGPTTDRPPGPQVAPSLDDGWREVLPWQLDELAAAWRDPGAWEGHTRVGGVDLPGSMTGLFALNEVLVHGWDLARGTGQGYEADEPSLRAAYGLLRGDRPADGPFGEPVPVPADAPLLDRVIGLTGRRPDWRPDR